MKFEEIEKLINLVDRSSLMSFTYQEGNETIHLSKCSDAIPQTHTAVAPVSSAPAPLVSEGSKASASVSAKEETPVSENLDLIDIKSPFVGSIFLTASGSDTPYVQEGDTVKKGQVLCMVEAMKVFNEIHASEDACVHKILVKEGDLTEYNQVIMQLRRL